MFEVDEQPGSGSWDPFVGLSLSKQLGKISVDANGLYKFATRGSRDSNLGDIVNYNLALSHRLLKDGVLSFNERKHCLGNKYSFYGTRSEQRPPNVKLVTGITRAF